MITLRRSKERGHADHGWLDTYHTFSFADYQDATHMGFRKLRVINEDVVKPAMGFGTHAHRDMEIVTYILEGRLEHKDSMGNGSVIGPGDIQRMSAGTGVTHSEFNPSKDKPVHLLQIWIHPEKSGLTPSYEEKHFNEKMFVDALCPIVSPKQSAKTVLIHQDVEIYASRLTRGKKVSMTLRPGRYAWIQLASGSIETGGQILKGGDGAAVSDETKIEILSKEDAHFLLFDLN